MNFWISELEPFTADVTRPGNYYNEIVAELQKNGQGVDPEHVSQSRFKCGSDGWITFNVYCHKGCQNGGKNSDWCLS